MCGVFGIVGKERTSSEIKRGLESISYRGYDSSGWAIISENKFVIEKTLGHPENLLDSRMESNIGIGHNRWASHGGVTVANAHPHLSNNKKIVVAHNGIIENYIEIKRELSERGFLFYSETDTEVIPNLLEYYFNQNQDMLDSIYRMSQKIQGAYALVIINLDIPDAIFCVRNGSPLCIGVAKDYAVVSSDVNSLLVICERSSILDNGKVAILKKNSVEIKSLKGEAATTKFDRIKSDIQSYNKLPYTYYMEKEIFEQPTYLRNALAGRILPKKAEIRLAGINSNLSDILNADEIIYTGCGSAFYAAQIGAMAMETIARKRCRAIPAGELQYYNAVITDKTVLITVSQSGETADTIGCINNFKKHNAKVLGVVNVINSSISRLVDSGIYIRAGQEIAVASTKAVLNQIVAMIILAALVGSKRDLAPLTYENLIKEIYSLPRAIERILSEESTTKIKAMAQKYASYEDMFCLARGILEPIAYEAALKIKEIAYIHAEGISGSEIKHGPLALISSDILTLAMIDDSPMEIKTVNNINEIKSRGGKVLGLLDKRCSPESYSSLDDFIEIDSHLTFPVLKTVEFLVAGQLLGYYLAVARNCEIDRPRHLAKSLTIE